MNKRNNAEKYEKINGKPDNTRWQYWNLTKDDKNGTYCIPQMNVLRQYYITEGIQNGEEPCDQIDTANGVPVSCLCQDGCLPRTPIEK